jgi:hypothetical protein
MATKIPRRDFDSALKSELPYEFALVMAAREWWAYHRPTGWSEEKHLKNPTINTTDAKERQLAMAVVRQLIAQRAK